MAADKFEWVPKVDYGIVDPLLWVWTGFKRKLYSGKSASFRFYQKKLSKKSVCDRVPQTMLLFFKLLLFDLDYSCYHIKV